MAGKLGSGAKGIWQALDGWKTWIVAIVLALKIMFPSAPVWGYASAIFGALGWNSVTPEVSPDALAGWGLFLVAVGHRLWKALAQIRAGVPFKDVLSTPPPKIAAGLALLAFLLLPGLALAQDVPIIAMATEQTETAPTPLSASIAAEQTEGVTIDVQTWTLSVLTRDERREYAGGRVTVDAPAGPVRLFARADISGTQDAHDFSFEDYKTFRSIEAFVGVRYPFKSGVALAVAGGATYSIEGSDGPADPRLYSLLALARFPLPGNGYAYAGGGYRGPVGGLAAVASVSYPMGPTRALADFDFPLQVDAAGLPKPWVLRTGIAVPLKKWTLK